MIERGKNTVAHWNQKHINQYGDNKPYDFDAIDKTEDSYHHVASEILKANTDTFNNKSLLEIGCGHGYFCAHMKKNVLQTYEIEGWDFSPSGIELAKNKAKELEIDIKYEERDFLLNPVENNYGVICMFEVLEHIEEDENYKVLDNILDHCEYFILSVPNTQDSCFGEHISHYDFDTFANKGYNVVWKAKLGKIDMSNTGDYGEYFHFITLFKGNLS